MVNGNTRVPNNHFHKHWNPNAAQKGHITTFFDQPAQKKARRVARAKKAALIFPRPVKGPVRPVVHCPTQRYNFRARIGRGFTIEELAQVKLVPRKARVLGIATDHRRRNLSKESLTLNVARLQAYLAKLKVFPKKAAAEAQKATQLKGRILPTPTAALNITPEAPRAVTAEEKARKSYEFLRKNRRFQHTVGYEIKRDKRQKAKAEAANKK